MKMSPTVSEAKRCPLSGLPLVDKDVSIEGKLSYMKQHLEWAKSELVELTDELCPSPLVRVIGHLVSTSSRRSVLRQRAKNLAWIRSESIGDLIAGSGGVF